MIDSAQPGEVIRFSPRLRGAFVPIDQGAITIARSPTLVGSRQAINPAGLSRAFTGEGPDVDVAIQQNVTITQGRATLDEENGYVGGSILVNGAGLTVAHSLFLEKMAIGGGDRPDESLVYRAACGAMFALDGASPSTAH